MSLAGITDARRDAMRAKARLESTLGAVQHRLSPGNLAEEAWDGVKDKSADLAGGALQAVKSRPKAVSLALGAFALFLARAPLKRAVSRLISGDGEGDGNDHDDAELSVPEGVS
jgi:hypothetical protein